EKIEKGGISPRGSILDQKAAMRRSVLVQMTQEMQSMQKPEVVITGFGEKLGEKVKSWTDRFFVLYSNGDFEYYYNVMPPKNERDPVDWKKGELRGKVSVYHCRFRY